MRRNSERKEEGRKKERKKEGDTLIEKEKMRIRNEYRQSDETERKIEREGGRYERIKSSASFSSALKEENYNERIKWHNA